MHTFSGGAGGGANFSLWAFLRGHFLWVGTFPGGELVRRNYTLGEFARIPIQNSF